MSKKIIIVSVAVLLLAVIVTAAVWFSISIVQRLNPELNIGSRGYIPEVPEDAVVECSEDRVCMELVGTEQIRTVPSTCNDDTDDVAFLESLGWLRCSAISAEPVAEVDTSNWVEYKNLELGFKFKVSDQFSGGDSNSGVCFYEDSGRDIDGGYPFFCVSAIENEKFEAPQDWWNENGLEGYEEDVPLVIDGRRAVSFVASNPELHFGGGGIHYIVIENQQTYDISSTTRFGDAILSTFEFIKLMSKETERTLNPSATREFYFMSDEEIFVTKECAQEDICGLGPNPFDIFFNGDSYFVVEPARGFGDLNQFGLGRTLRAIVRDRATGDVKTLMSIGSLTNKTGGVDVVGWVDDENLLVRMIGEGPQLYALIDVVSDAITYKLTWADTWFGVPFQIFQLTVGEIVFVQKCDSVTGPCDEVRIYRNPPENAWYPFEGIEPIGTVSTNNPMNVFGIDEAMKFFRSDADTVTVMVGDGYFVFDIKNGRILDIKNL